MITHYVANGCSNCDLAVEAAEGHVKQNAQRGIGWGISSRLYDGAVPPASETPRSLEHFRDGLSNTVLVGEKRWLASATPCNNSTGWVSGAPVSRGGNYYGYDTLFSGIKGALASDETNPDVQCNSQAGGPHQGGGNVLFGDGSVRFVELGVHPDLWRAQLSIAGGEDLDSVSGELLSP